MKKKNCKQYAKKYLGYPYNDKFCKGNDCVCSYQEQPLCKNIKCDDQQEGIRKSKEECDKFMNNSTVFTCNDEICKGNDCVCILGNNHCVKIPDVKIQRKVDI